MASQRGRKSPPSTRSNGAEKGRRMTGPASARVLGPTLIDQQARQHGSRHGHRLVPAKAHTSRSSSLRPKMVLVDKSPVDLKTEAGPITKVQVTIVEHRVLAEEAIRQRIGLRPTM